MPKIRVQDLAKMMKVPEQDLVFKLRSLGVRIEGGDAGIEAEALQAILQGKRLASPREVIMEDSTEGEPAAAAPAQAPAPPPRPAPAAKPLKPVRRRTIVEKGETRILTIPTTQTQEAKAPAPAPTRSRPAAPAEAPAAAASAEPKPAEATPAKEAPTPEAPAERPAEAAPRPAARATPTARPRVPTGGVSARPSGGVSAKPGETASRTATPGAPRRGAILIHRPTEPYRPTPPPTRGRPPRSAPGGAPGRPPGGGLGRPAGPGRPSGPGRPAGPGRPGGGPPGRPGGGFGRPGGGPGPGRGRNSDRPGKKSKRRRKSQQPIAEGSTDIRSLRGSLEDIEQVVNEAVVPTGPALKRKRRLSSDPESVQALDIKPTRKAEDGPVVISEGMTVREFAEKLGVRVRDLIKVLFERGILANINHVIDPELGVAITESFGFEAKVMTFEEEMQSQVETETEDEEADSGTVARAPVVTIMGHVDHGKTSLLDKIRSSKIAEGESGGITQHIGAYHVDVKDRQIVFLDTPGHEAFTLMRARGAKVTDVVILVVAADDGVMPQTQEAIDHAQAAGVPILVALNKIDKSNANPDRVKKQLGEKGLMPEDWGGQTVVVPVSAVRGDGIDDLLEMVLLTSDLLELKADPERPAHGVVLEARKETGRGVVATVLVQNGSLSVGDVFVSGSTWGRVRSMADDRGNRAQKTGPATAVEVTGFQDVPEAGDTFQSVDDEQKARGIVEFRQVEQRRRELQPSTGKVSLDQLFSRIQAGEAKELGIILKADVQGSVEVLRDAIEKLSTQKVRVKVLHSAVGAVTTNDVLLAAASEAIVVGFSVRPERNASELADKEEVEIRLHTVIYELLDELKKAMTGLLDPTVKEVQKGRAEVRELFKVPKIGMVAGCHVLEGVIPRSANVRLLRDNRVIHEGKISSLRRFKDDASEVRAGFDCGIGIDRFNDLKPGDVIEAFVKEEVAAVLT